MKLELNDTVNFNRRARAVFKDDSLHPGVFRITVSEGAAVASTALELDAAKKIRDWAVWFIEEYDESGDEPDDEPAK